MIEQSSPIDTQHRDHDPRKTAFAVNLLHQHQDALRIYQDFGLMVKVSNPENGGQKRKHMAPEHMVTVIAGTQALGQLLSESGILSDKSKIFETEQAAAIHDAGKELEFLLVNTALKDNPTSTDYQNILSNPNIKISNQHTFNTKIAEYFPKMISSVSKGIRTQAAYDLAGDINELRLQEKGVSSDILKIQKMVGHSSCPEIEKLVDSFDQLDDSKKQQALQIFILHYLDDLVTNPNIIDPQITTDFVGNRLNALDRRCLQNENNPKYQEYNLAWKNDSRNPTNETAFAMQRRVGHKVETFLANLLGVKDPLTLPSLIDQKIKENIQKKSNLHSN